MDHAPLEQDAKRWAINVVLVSKLATALMTAMLVASNHERIQPNIQLRPYERLKNDFGKMACSCGSGTKPPKPCLRLYANATPADVRTPKAKPAAGRNDTQRAEIIIQDANRLITHTVGPQATPIHGDIYIINSQGNNLYTEVHASQHKMS